VEASVERNRQLNGNGIGHVHCRARVSPRADGSYRTDQAGTLVKFFQLSQQEIEGALLALEAEGFVLRGKFHPAAQEIEWCDRRLLARIHRLTINRLRAEIQPVSIAEFQRFLLSWQRADEEHRVEGLEGVRAVLESLDGYELPAAAWEPEVLALRIKDYTPAWLDQLCFHRTHRLGTINFAAKFERPVRVTSSVEPGIIVHSGAPCKLVRARG